MTPKNRRRLRRIGRKAVRAFCRHRPLLVELIRLAHLLAVIWPAAWPPCG